MSELVKSNPATLHEAIEDCESAWQRFLAAVDRTPIDQVEEPGVCGIWSLKIVVGHVGYWDGLEADYFELGSRPDELDWQAMNDENAEANAARPFADIVAEAKSNHRRMIEIIRATPNLDPGNVRELTYDHYVAHASEFESWLAGSES